MDTFNLNLAVPVDPAECLENPLPEFLLTTNLWIAYLNMEDVYLADVNDDSRRENDLDRGMEAWVSCVQKIFTVLCRWSGGIAIEFAVSRATPWNRLLRRIMGSKDQDGLWNSSLLANIPSELLYSMSTYGWGTVIWTTINDGGWDTNRKKKIRTSKLISLIQTDVVRWWMTHGYKEPYLAIYNPLMDRDAMATLFQKGLALPVRIESDKQFTPHRVRMHRRFFDTKM